MIEVLKQMVEILEYINEGANNQGAHTGISWRDVSNKAQPAIQAGRQAIAELESQESQIKTTDLFESAKVEDYNRGWNDCLFASGIVKQSQRTWVGLTDEEVKHEWEVWRANVPRYAGFATGIEAKLKQNNGFA